MKRILKKFNEFISFNKHSEIEDRFNKLSDKMIEETYIQSSLGNIMRNENYIKLKEMGNDIVPFLMEKINNESGISYLMLMSGIVGSIDVPESHKGDIVLLKEDWNKWWDLNKSNYDK